MSKRITSQFKTSTMPLVQLLDSNELSFREILWNLHGDEQTLSRIIKKLVDDGIIVRKFHHNDIVYIRAHHSPIAHFAYALTHKSK